MRNVTGLYLIIIKFFPSLIKLMDVKDVLMQVVTKTLNTYTHDTLHLEASWVYYSL
jgi:hypothetical protein